MCSIIVYKINKNLVNIVREYLLSVNNRNELIKIRKYCIKISNIKSQYLYLCMKRNYSNVMVINKSPYFPDTLIVSNKGNDSSHINIYDIPYQDICKIKDKTLGMNCITEKN